MSGEKEKHIRETAERLIGQGNTDVIDVAFTAEYVAHSENKDHKGKDFIKRFTRQLRTAIPNLKINDIHVLVENGNTITWLRSLQGVHENDMMGIPASGKIVKWNEMVVSRFEDGKIAEEWLVSNLAGQLLLKQQKRKM